MDEVKPKKKSSSDQKLTEVYFELLDQYTQKYGKVALFMANGNFYQLYGVSNSSTTLGNPLELKEVLGLRFAKEDSTGKTPVNSIEKPLMMGFQIQFLDSYLKKACEAGFVCVVYRQKTTPEGSAGKKVKKERELFKIVDYSTLEVESSSTSEYVSNVMCLYVDRLKTDGEDIIDVSVACVNLSSGEVVCHTITNTLHKISDAVIKVVYSYHPKEVYLRDPTLSLHLSEVEKGKGGDVLITKTDIPKKFSTFAYQDEIMKRTYKESVSQLGLANHPNVVIALSYMLFRLYELDVTIVGGLEKPKLRFKSAWLGISKNEIDQLALVKSDAGKSVFDIINRASTPMGKKALRLRLLFPLTSVKLIRERYENIDVALNPLPEGDGIPLWKTVEPMLESIGDLEKYHRKLQLETLSPYELVMLDKSYDSVLEIARLTNKVDLHSGGTRIMVNIKKIMRMMDIYRSKLKMDVCEDITDLAGLGVSIFKSGVDAELDELQDTIENSKQTLERVCSSWAETIGCPPDAFEVRSTPSEGYFIRGSLKRAEALMKKTEGLNLVKLSNAAKIFSPLVTKHGSNIDTLTEAFKDKNKSKYIELLRKIRVDYQDILKFIIDFITIVDVTKSCAKVAEIQKYTRPIIKKMVDNNGSWLNAETLRHPIIETFDIEFKPQNILLDGRGWLLFGVNGSGKSVLLKMVSLAVILAQAGMFVPASSFTFYPFTDLFIKMTLTDDIYRGESLFTKEMRYLKGMTDNASPRSLILADELCNGTVIEDAVCIVGGSIAEFCAKKTNFIITTHLQNLPKLEEIKKLSDRIVYKHISVEVRDAKIISDRILRDDPIEFCYGVELAKQMGVGSDLFISTATKIKRQLEGRPTELVSEKKSRYNSKVYMTECAYCGTTINLHTHHIKPQADADEYGMIGSEHKNKSTNLGVLCEECHTKIAHGKGGNKKSKAAKKLSDEDQGI